MQLSGRKPGQIEKKKNRLALRRVGFNDWGGQVILSSCRFVFSAIFLLNKDAHMLADHLVMIA